MGGSDYIFKNATFEQQELLLVDLFDGADLQRPQIFGNRPGFLL